MMLSTISVERRLNLLFNIQQNYHVKKKKLIHSQINDNREFVASRPALQEKLMGVLQAATKGHLTVTQIHIKK